MEALLNFDLSVFEWIRESLWCPAADTAVTVFTHLGEGGIIWIILGVILLVPKKTRKAGIAVLASVLVMKVFNNIIKELVERPRPFNLLADWDGIKAFPELAARWAEGYVYPNLVPYPESLSFPSGHTAAAFSAATGLTMAVKKAKAGIPIFLAAAVMGFTRIYLHVHYCTDVIGGALLGIVYGIAGYFIATGIYSLLIKKFPKIA